MSQPPRPSSAPPSTKSLRGPRQVARHGKVDRYPHAGRFATSAMAEGAIEGTAAMYEMDSPYATHFKFSRFDAMSLQALPYP